MSLKLRQFIIFFGDIVLLYFALVLSLILRNQKLITADIWTQHWPLFTVIFLIWLMVFYIAGLYNLNETRNDIKFFINASRVAAINFLLAISFFYVLPQAQIAPKTILILTAIIFFVLFILWRHLIHGYISSATLKKNMLLIGDNAIIRELIKILNKSPQIGYQPAAILAEGYSTYDLGIACYQKFADLKAIIKRHQISTIVFDSQSLASKELIKNLYENLSLRLELFSLSNFYENITKKIALETVSQIWFLENIQESNKKIFDASKRVIDLILALIGGLISLILIPIISLAVLIASGRPIFFTQTRLGKAGKQFRAIKFRTMINNAEGNGPQWAQKNDPRVTKVGRFLRKTRLDEIPQLFNIIKGEMSFVGPRPERPEFVRQLEKEIPFYRDRLLTKPGLTGWSQVNYPYGASVQDGMKKLQYDLYYIKNRSFILDLAIILKTIKIVLSGIGQ